jgi:hypothetical protein
MYATIDDTEKLISSLLKGVEHVDTPVPDQCDAGVLANKMLGEYTFTLDPEIDMQLNLDGRSNSVRQYDE